MGIGFILLCMGLVGVVVSAAGQYSHYSRDVSGATTARDLASDISGTLIPAAIGAFLALPGAILVLLDVLRGRKSQRRQA